MRQVGSNNAAANTARQASSSSSKLTKTFYKLRSFYLSVSSTQFALSFFYFHISPQFHLSVALLLGVYTQTKNQMQSNVNALWHVRIRRRTFFRSRCSAQLLLSFCFFLFFFVVFLENKNSHTSLHYIIDGPTVVDRMQCKRRAHTKQTQTHKWIWRKRKEEIKWRKKIWFCVRHKYNEMVCMSPRILERWQWHASLPKSATIQKSETTTTTSWSLYV